MINRSRTLLCIGQLVHYVLGQRRLIIWDGDQRVMEPQRARRR
ncbi:MAG TPA: hypothetical protein VEH31_45195 [Streptosporangiaceae bacterium]|nr:hypothetical protein [Streptosporangiaceae bacterium]